MDTIECGLRIKKLRIEKKLTQKQLAQRIGVSDKAVSKWERGAGLPDISLIAPLSRELGVTMDHLLEKGEEGGKMKRRCFYFCPVCGSHASSEGEMEISCCGKRLVPEYGVATAEGEGLVVEDVEDEIFVSSPYPQSKEDHVDFIALESGERIETVRTYPEWDISARFRKRRGRLFFHRTKSGLFVQKIR